MTIDEIIFTDQAGNLSELPDPALYAAQNKVDVAAAELRKNPEWDRLRPYTFKHLEDLSGRISHILNTRYGCND